VPQGQFRRVKVAWLKPEIKEFNENNYYCLKKKTPIGVFYFIIHDRLDIANAPFIVDRVFVNPF
jgi:hypothetical protein